jgi:hypothetical protein
MIESPNEVAVPVPGQRAACLDYADDIGLSAEAERDPKAFICSRLKARHGLHR